MKTKVTAFKAAEHRKNIAQFASIQKAANDAAKPFLKNPPLQKVGGKQDWRKG